MARAISDLGFSVAKQDRLTSKQEAVLQALVTGMNQTQAAKSAGVTREYVCRLCQKDHFLAEIEHRVQRMKKLLAPGALANVAKLAANAKSERIRLDANLGLLDRSGHSKSDGALLSVGSKQVSVIIDLR